MGCRQALFRDLDLDSNIRDPAGVPGLCPLAKMQDAMRSILLANEVDPLSPHRRLHRVMEVHASACTRESVIHQSTSVEVHPLGSSTGLEISKDESLLPRRATRFRTGPYHRRNVRRGTPMLSRQEIRRRPHLDLLAGRHAP